jgi:hypothetical protein
MVRVIRERKGEVVGPDCYASLATSGHVGDELSVHA